VHRDFKPENVLIGGDGRARVSDFGLARRSSFSQVMTETDPDGGFFGKTALATLTRTGAIAGTPAYMAPEQLLGRAATARTDQFSYCVALYEALYGERPFFATTYEELYDAVLNGRVRPEPPGTTVPSAVRRVLLRGVAVEQEKRYPSMRALLDALASAEKSRSRRARWTVVAVTAGVVAVAAAAVPITLHTTRTASARSATIAPAIATTPSAPIVPSATATLLAADLAPAPSAEPSAEPVRAAPKPKPKASAPRVSAPPPPPASAPAPETKNDPYDRRR
jgi:serine/threonine protein kinase